MYTYITTGRNEQGLVLFEPCPGLADRAVERQPTVLQEHHAVADLERARRALADVGLAGYAERHPRDLSSGERERLALAAVLVAEPDLLVLDEPTRGVDPERKHELAALLRANTARATLVVTHDRAFAKALADRVVSLAPDRELVHA